MSAQFDSEMPCLFCNKKVLIQAVGWTHHHVALCRLCFPAVSLTDIRMMFFLRCQIAALEIKLQQLQQLQQQSTWTPPTFESEQVLNGT